jgi:hypothetical protein
MHDVEHSVGLGSCRIMLKAYDGNNSSTLLKSVLRRSGISKPISDSRRRNLLIEVSTGCFAIIQEKYWEGTKRKISTVCFASFSKLPVVCVMLLLKGDR